MPHKLTKSQRTASPDIGDANELAIENMANDNLIWDRALFAERVRELGDSSATNLLVSLLQYCDTIAAALRSEMLNEAIFRIIRSDLAPVSHFVGFSSLSSLLLTADVSQALDRQRLIAAIAAVAAECRHYCDAYA